MKHILQATLSLFVFNPGFRVDCNNIIRVVYVEILSDKQHLFFCPSGESNLIL